jgi:hypothetical protein
MSTPLDLDKLMELAEKATPGPWYDRSDGAVGCGCITEEQDQETGQRYLVDCQHWVGMAHAPADAAFIAACSPDAIRELVGRCRRAEEERDRYKTEYERARDEAMFLRDMERGRVAAAKRLKDEEGDE